MHEIDVVRPMSPSKSVHSNQILSIVEHRVVFVGESVVASVISISYLLILTLVRSKLVLMDDVRTIRRPLGQFLSVDPSIVLILLAFLGSLGEMLFSELVFGE